MRIAPMVIRKAIPQRWVSRLSVRTTDRDDGKVFELLRKAKRDFT